MRLVAEPSIPFALWLTLAVLAIAVWIWYSFTSRMTVSKKRRQLILALMAGCLSLPLILLLNLTWIQRIPPPAGKPVVHVVVDTSASMLTEDANGTQDEAGAEQTSRLQSATTIASDVATSMEDAFDVRLWTFNQGINASSADSISAPSETTSADDSSSAMAKTSRRASLFCYCPTGYTMLRNRLKSSKQPPKPRRWTFRSLHRPLAARSASKT